MAWQQMIDRLTGNRRGIRGVGSRGSRRSRNRRLLLERLDRREVLASNIGAIAGIAFTDQALDGLSPGDPRLEGVTVELYQDDGAGNVGTLVTAGPDADTLFGTTTTASGLDPVPGLYRFDDLSPGDYWVVQSAVAGLASPDPLLVTVTNDGGVQVQLIDDYSLTGQTVSATGANPTVTESVVAPEVIGGARDIEVFNASGVGLVTAFVDDFNDELRMGTTGAEGSILIQYDGLDDDIVLDPGGLGGVALAGGLPGEPPVPNSGLNVVAFAQLAGDDLEIRIYTDAANFSTATIPVPSNGGSFAQIFVPFSDFVVGGGATGAADFNNVGAIEAFMGLSLDNDAFVSIVETLQPDVVMQNLVNIQQIELGGELFFDVGAGVGEFNNGLLDAGEPGVPVGTDVDLYQVASPADSINVGVDVPIASTTTGVGGSYSFAGLDPGNYVVVIPESNFQPGGNLEAFASSSGLDPTPDPNNQIDGQDKGSLIVGLGVATGTITLVSNAQPDDDSDPNRNTTIDFGFVPVADLEISKELNVALSENFSGGTVVFDVSVTNNGPNDASGVEVVDVLPAGLTFDSIQNPSGVFTTSVNGSTVTVEIGDLANTEVATFQIVAIVGDNETGQITNTANVSTGNQIDPDETNNSDDAVLNLITSDLRITKTDQTDPVNAGEQQVYTLEVFNDGPDDASGVVVTDPLPAGVTFLGGDLDGDESAISFDAVTNTVTVTIGDLVNGATATIALTVAIPPDATSPLINTASVAATPNTDPDLGNNSTQVESTVDRVVDIALTKTAVGTAVAGGSFTYTVEVTNLGPGDARDVTIIDTLLGELTFESLDPGTSGATLTQVGQELTFELGTLLAGTSASFSFDVSIASSAAGTLANSATVSTSDIDSDPSNDSDDVIVPVEREVDLVLEKSVDLVTAIPGQDQLVYTITVSHAAGSTSDALDIVVTDVLPAGLSGQVIDAPTADGTNFDAGTRTATVTFDTLPVGEFRSFTITVDVNPDTTGSIINPASVVSATPDLDPTDNTDAATTDLTPQFDVAVTKDVNDPAVQPGDNVTFAIGVSNTGPSTATGVEVTDVVPSGLTFVSATLGGQPGTLVGGTIEFAAVTLDPGQSLTGTVTFSVNEDAAGSVTNTVAVSSDPGDSNLNNNTASDDTVVTPIADLLISKSVDVAANAQPGTPLVYTITVTNDGPSQAVNVEVIDTLPAGVTFVSGNGPNNEPLAVANGQVVVDGGTLPSGDNFSFTITVNVNAGANGNLVNSATVSSDTLDPNAANDSASATSSVDPVTSSVSGFVYVDANANGTRDPGEEGIPGVTITLTGVDLLGNPVNRVSTTDANGLYTFTNLPGGTYDVAQPVQPPGFRNGQEEAGTGATAIVNDDVFTELGLNPATTAVDFNFGELLEPLSKRRFLASAQAN